MRLHQHQIRSHCRLVTEPLKPMLLALPACWIHNTKSKAECQAWGAAEGQVVQNGTLPAAFVCCPPPGLPQGSTAMPHTVRHPTWHYLKYNSTKLVVHGNCYVTLLYGSRASPQPNLG